MPAHALEKIRVVILAGRRPEGDPVADMFGVTYKAAVKIGARTMLNRVVDSLDASGRIDGIYILSQSPAELASQPEFGDLKDRPDVHFEESGSSICASILAFTKRHPGQFPMLVTTSDHALLMAEDVVTFLDRAPKDADLSVGLIEDKVVLAAQPTAKRTWLKFANGAYTSCNLFLLRTPKAGAVLDFWASVEQLRKKTLHLAWRLGPGLFIPFFFHVLTLDRAFAKVSRKIGAHIKPVLLDRAELSIDVDKPSDLELAKEILGH